jgi:mycofactocin system glycosyltransferase
LIDACLRSLSALDYPRDRFEVIVVDDCSTDGTAEAAERWAATLPLRVLRAATHQGPGESRNMGARNATGDVLAFIDGDCLADGAWLADLVPAFARAEVVAAGGLVISAEERTWVQRYEGVRHPSFHGTAESEVRPGTSNDFLPGCNMLVRRQVFIDLGGFDTTHALGEDVDLSWRLAQVGRIAYIPRGRVAHHHVDRVDALLRRRTVLGSSEAILFRRYPDRRRSIGVSLPQLLSVAWIVFAALVQPALIPLTLIPLVADYAAAAVISRRRGTRIGPRRLVVALIKAHLSVAYRVASLTDRYFMVPLLVGGGVAGVFWRPALLFAATSVVLSLAIAVIEWARSRPPLGLFTFIAMNTLDRAAVNLGILLGCLRYRTLLPLRLRLGVARSTVDVLRVGHAGGSLERHPLFAIARAPDGSSARKPIVR